MYCTTVLPSWDWETLERSEEDPVRLGNERKRKKKSKEEGRRESESESESETSRLLSKTTAPY